MARFALMILLTLFLSQPSLAESSSSKLSGPQIWQELFVPALQDKFRKDNPSLSKVESMIKALGGEVVFDHGGTRTADPQVYTFLTRIANAFGLQVKDQYKFPSKYLEAVDIQLPGQKGFKWFSTLVRYDDLPQEIAQLVEEDCQDNRPHMSARGIELLEQLESQKYLSPEDAQELVHEIVHKYFRRHGKPLSKKTLDSISVVSQETANALLLGPDFNHLALSLNEINIPQWYGLEVIEVIEHKLKSTNFKMLDSIQGKLGGELRQTSIMADKSNFPVLLEGGITSSVSYPGKYVEFVQRGAIRDKEGRIQFTGDKVAVFQGFLRDNAEKIFDSTNPEHK